MSFISYSFLKKHAVKIILALITLNLFSFIASLIVFYTNQFIVFRNITGFIIFLTLILNYVAGNLLTGITNMSSIKGRLVNMAFDLYILYSIYSFVSLLGISYFRIFSDIVPFVSLFGIAIVFAFLVLRWKDDTEMFMDPQDPNAKAFQRHPIEVIVRNILIVVLIILYLVVTFLIGSFAFQTSNLVSAGSGMFISVATMVIYLVLLAVTQIFLRLFPVSRKPAVHKITVAWLVVLTILFALPLASMPVTISSTDQQFEKVFGNDWQSLPEEHKQYFLETPFDLSSPYFGIEIGKNFEVIEGIVYKNTTNYTLYYDVHIPKQTGVGENRTIIFLHGGGWTGGSRSLSSHLKVYFANQGYVVFSIDYRLVDTSLLAIKEEIGLNISVSSSPETQYRAGPYQIKDMIQDIGDFTHYLANLSYAYGADLSRVTFLGQSAGGYLAAIVALGYTDPWFGNLFNQTLKMESLILYYPPDDAESFFYKSHPFYHAAFKMIDGTPETNPEEYYHFTPSNLVGPDSPPCVLLHGTMDTLVYEENSLRIQQKYVEFNRPVIYIKYHFVGHAFTMNSQYHPISIYYLERFLYKVPTLNHMGG